MKLRVRLSKTGLARFFSHLDLQRTLERTLRRAGLPIALSHGFNPHPRISYASALATGTSSEGEFVDVELSQPMAPAQFLAEANRCCPAGLGLEDARPVDPKGASLMSLVNAAEYRLSLSGGALEHLADAVAAFLAAESIAVTKAGTAGPRLVNMRPQVHALAVAGPGILRAAVQTGSQGNLKPEDLVNGLCHVAPALGHVSLTQTHRLMLYRHEAESGRLTEAWDL